MKNWIKIGLVAILVFMLAVSVSGCTSSSSSSKSALTMSAKTISTTTSPNSNYSIAKVNATINNDNAGTVRITSNNFELQDSSSQVHSPISPSSNGITIENGEGAWMQVSFYIAEGSHPTQLTYYDGTNKAVCPVS